LNKPETTPPTYFHHIRDGTDTGSDAAVSRGTGLGRDKQAALAFAQVRGQ